MKAVSHAEFAAPGNHPISSLLFVSDGKATAANVECTSSIPWRQINWVRACFESTRLSQRRPRDCDINVNRASSKLVRQAPGKGAERMANKAKHSLPLKDLVMITFQKRWLVRCQRYPGQFSCTDPHAAAMVDAANVICCL